MQDRKRNSQRCCLREGLGYNCASPFFSHDLILENCTFGPDCDRAFEYSTLKADIKGKITNIKNPTSGEIVADEIGSVTIDKNIKAPADCRISLR